MSRIEECWSVNISGGVSVCVSPSISKMSAYILLEQEDWFEDEISFVRSFVEPGMNVLDIGANHGVYSLSVAGLLQDGHVWAFEPTVEPRVMFERSVLENKLSSKVSIVPVGLSDEKKKVFIKTSENSELNSIYGDGSGGELIDLEPLDGYFNGGVIPTDVSFVKMDAEGEEVNVLKGGEGFFKSQSPLVMFELKHGGSINEKLVGLLRDFGYSIYRLLPYVNVLIPYGEEFDDGAVLNLFACKDDCAARLVERGFLVNFNGKISESCDSFDRALVLGELAGFPCYGKIKVSSAVCPEEYVKVLGLFLEMINQRASAEQRVVSLFKAIYILDFVFPESDPQDFSVQLLRIFLLNIAGYRSRAVALANQALVNLGEEKYSFNWPVVPPLVQFLHVERGASITEWVRLCLMEFIELRGSFSSYFVSDPLRSLGEILNIPGHSVFVQRRALLAAVRNGQRVTLPLTYALFNKKVSPNYRIWLQVVNSYNTLQYFNDVRIRVVDIGASSHGELTEPYAPLIAADIASVIGFEPNVEECNRLNELYASNGSYKYLPSFVGLGGEAKFHETNWFMTGSLYPPNKKVLDNFEQLDSVVTLQAVHSVGTVRIEDLVDVDDIDLVKIDVQGAELDVFSGMGSKLENALVIWTEVEFIPLYEGQPLFSEVEMFLREKGFAFHSFDSVVSRAFKPYSGLKGKYQMRDQAIWADAIFVRNFENFDMLDERKLKKLAVILDMVVGARDLCHKVLSVLDSRLGTNLSDDYYKKLN